MSKKITALTDEQINYWVAKAQGWDEIEQHGFSNEDVWLHGSDYVMNVSDYTPTTNSAQAWDLMIKYELLVGKMHNEERYGAKSLTTQNINDISFADTPQKAVCLAVIASVYGEEIE